MRPKAAVTVAVATLALAGCSLGGDTEPDPASDAEIDRMLDSVTFKAEIERWANRTIAAGGPGALEQFCARLAYAGPEAHYRYFKRGFGDEMAGMPTSRQLFDEIASRC